MPGSFFTDSTLSTTEIVLHRVMKLSSKECFALVQSTLVIYSNSGNGL
ncbi:MAG: hypothetical protein ACXWRZ_10200 [Bdellovibrio sp.]